MNSLKKEKQSIINKVLLLLVDGFSVALCSFLGLLMRFDMNVAHIPAPYMPGRGTDDSGVYPGDPGYFLGGEALPYVVAVRQLQGTDRDCSGGGGFDRVYDYLQLFYL